MKGQRSKGREVEDLFLDYSAGKVSVFTFFFFFSFAPSAKRWFYESIGAGPMGRKSSSVFFW